MTKEELKHYYDKLNEIYRKSLEFYHDYKNGKNKTIRDTAERRLHSEISNFKAICNSNTNLYTLLFADNKPELIGMPSTIKYDETIQVRYFTDELHDILKKIQDAIN